MAPLGLSTPGTQAMWLDWDCCDVNNQHPLVECLGCPEFLLLQMTLCMWLSSFESFMVRPEVAGGGVPI